MLSLPLIVILNRFHRIQINIINLNVVFLRVFEDCDRIILFIVLLLSEIVVVIVAA